MDDIFSAPALLLYAGMFVSGLFAGIELANDRWEEGVIRREFGIYCPTDGHFAWKGECEK